MDKRAIADRFWSKVEAEGDCLIWRGASQRDGYGRFWLTAREHIKAHRWAYISVYGALPEEKPLVLHRCDVRKCVRPDHLWAGTNADNNHDMQQKGRLNTADASAAHRAKTHCPQGHPYSVENTIVRARGWRQCGTCKRESLIRSRAVDRVRGP